MQLVPNNLPDIKTLRLRARALAMIEAIVSPEWEDRYYSFDASWGEGEEMASMRNGCGDDWAILFGPFGAAIKGVAHETSPTGKEFALEVQKQVPKTFASFLNEPAFGMDWLNFCYWRSPYDSEWHKVFHPDLACANVDDGSEEFLSLLFEPALSYVEFAKWYYEIDLPLDSVERIFKQSALTSELILSLNSDANAKEVEVFAKEIGFPFERTGA